MSHFAKVENGVVTQVIVAEQDFIATGALGDPASWIQTSYNTQGGIHLLGGEPLRGNYAGVGYTYDAFNDIFYAPQPFASWELDIPTATWVAPTAYPEDGKVYSWDEGSLSWVEAVSEAA